MVNAGRHGTMSGDGDTGFMASRRRVWYYQSRRRDNQNSDAERKADPVDTRHEGHGKDAAFTEGNEKQ